MLVVESENCFTFRDQCSLEQVVTYRASFVLTAAVDHYLLD